LDDQQTWFFSYLQILKNGLLYLLMPSYAVVVVLVLVLVDVDVLVVVKTIPSQLFPVHLKSAFLPV